MAGTQPTVPGVTCPICGLRFTAVVDDHGMTIPYVMEEWQQRCPSATLDSPSLCPSFFAKIWFRAFRIRFAVA
jgi:hypothetical protein